MRIAIASRQSVTRSAIKRLLQIKLGLGQIGEAATTADLMAQIESVEVDLVVLDVDIWDQPAGQLVTDIKRIADPPVVFVLGGRPDMNQTFLDAGADAFLYKGDPPQSLLLAVENVRQGQDDAS